MEEGQYEISPQFTPVQQKKINKRFIYLIGAIIVLILLFIGYKALNSSGNNTNSTLSLTPTPTEFVIPTDIPSPTDSLTPTEAETPTPTPTSIISITPKPTQNPVDKTTGLDRSKLSVTVENGSGKSGVAKLGGDFLTNLGYEVTTTTNADNADYTGVTIQVKSASSDFLALLKKDLATEYTITSFTSDLANSFSSGALVIIGK